MDITEEVKKRILEKVMSIRPGCVRVEMGRTAVVFSHCKEKMIQVRVFYKNLEVPTEEKEGTDEYVCPKCLDTMMPLSDFEAYSLASK